MKDFYRYIYILFVNKEEFHIKLFELPSIPEWARMGSDLTKVPWAYCDTM